jgi:hypothetical protein
LLLLLALRLAKVKWGFLALLDFPAHFLYAMVAYAVPRMSESSGWLLFAASSTVWWYFLSYKAWSALR